jgi:translation initiation factor IF-3
LRVIGADGEQAGVMTRAEALQLAVDAALDLVEVSPNAEPPVVRVMDFGKFLFEQNKKAHSAKRKQKQIQVKEVKFRPGTEEGDYQVKLRNLIRFLTEGDKAKVTMRYRGREMAHQEIGRRLLARVQTDLAEHVFAKKEVTAQRRLSLRQTAAWSAPSGFSAWCRKPCERKLEKLEFSHAQVEDEPGGGEASAQDRQGVQVLFRRPAA